jgi:hypothetical protein
LLPGAGYTQAAGADDVIADAVITAQAGRGDQSHQLFGALPDPYCDRYCDRCGRSASPGIIGLVGVAIETGAGLKEAAREFFSATCFSLKTKTSSFGSARALLGTVLGG